MLYRYGRPLLLCLALQTACASDSTASPDGGPNGPADAGNMAGQAARGGGGGSAAVSGRGGSAAGSGHAGEGGGGATGTAGRAAEGGRGAAAGGGGGKSAADAGLADLDAGDLDDSGADHETRDGSYRCRGEQALGDSCSEPLVDSQFGASDHWTLDVAGDQLTITSVGFDQTEFGCSGTWSSNDFVCDATWTRAGRQCPSTLHLRRETDATLTFWINNQNETLASCRK
jgi:hypothetical protein